MDEGVHELHSKINGRLVDRQYHSRLYRWHIFDFADGVDLVSYLRNRMLVLSGHTDRLLLFARACDRQGLIREQRTSGAVCEEWMSYPRV